MGFGSKQGFPGVKIDISKPTFTIKGGGGKVSVTLTQANPTFTLTVT